MFEIKVEPVFESDYKKIMRRRPHLEPAFKEALDELTATGTVPASCNPHPLAKQGGSHTGHVAFHLSDGEIDAIVLYTPHKTNPRNKPRNKTCQNGLPQSFDDLTRTFACNTSPQ